MLNLIQSASIALTLLLYNVPGTESIKLNENGTCNSTLNSKCTKGIILPLWEPIDNITLGDKIARSAVYFVALVYLFLGVSIIADRFMAAIEVITSKEKEVIIKKKNGEKQIISVRIWNETVSNLTLMALGSSAPEILLSVIEIVGDGFKAGALGPGTIVGSAAFNLFVIIGICILVIPEGEVRRIKHVGVFFITASWSIFAYLWLYLIIAVISPKRVDVWEALLTFVFFFLTVLTAYVADTKIFFKKFMKKKYHPAGKIKAVADGDLELRGDGDDVEFPGDVDSAQDNEFEKHRLEYVEAIKEIRKKHPNIDTKQLEEMAQLEVLNRGPKSRAFYRMQATRQLTGSGNVIKKAKVERHASEEDLNTRENDYGPDIQQIYFDPGHYTVMENVGSFRVYVTRQNGDFDSRISVDYTTEDGTAVAGEDYQQASGTLIFEPGDKHQHFEVSIIDDDIFEEDEHFNVRLSNLQVLNSKSEDEKFKLVDPSLATIMVLDDDHSGVFHFEFKEVDVSESSGTAEISVKRSSGGRGVVRLPYQTIEATAKGGGVDYEDVAGFLEFENDQTEAAIRVRIIDDNDYEKNEFFFIQLGEPILVEKDKAAEERFAAKMKNTMLRKKSSFKNFNFTKNNGNLFQKLAHHFSDDTAKATEDIKKMDLMSSDPKSGEKPEVDTGKPRLGEITRLQVHIKESDEFKNTIDRLMKHGKMALVVSTSSWKEQFTEAITVSAGGEGGEDEDGEMQEKLPSCTDYVMHFLTIFWKVLFACVPPTDYAGGWLCFTVCIILIGMLTAVIGDLASGFGCNVGLTDSVTAITFVALGTSVPDTFASKVAAVGDDYADGSVGNVTGSNAVNVFLGIGVAWSIAAIHHWRKDSVFEVQPGSLGFSVTLFCIFALCAVIILFLRRRQPIGGELGGPNMHKYISSGFFFSMWLLYVIISSLENYCYIEGF